LSFFHKNFSFKKKNAGNLPFVLAMLSKNPFAPKTMTNGNETNTPWVQKHRSYKNLAQ